MENIKQQALERLQHYVSHTTDLLPMANFCQVGLRVVVSWRDGTFPRGIILTRAVAFLVAKSDRGVNGLDLKSANFRAMLVLALGLRTSEEMAKEFGFTYYYDVFPVLFNDRPLSEQRSKIVTDILETNSEIVFDFLSSPSPDNRNINLGTIVKSFVDLSAILKRLEPDLDSYINSDAQARLILREELEKNNVSLFKESNILYRVLDKINRLCSEKSLNQKKS